MSASSYALSTPDIPSIQLRSDGITSRFTVVPWGDRFDWSALALAESSTGVQASLRCFVEEQLEGGDVVLDLAPGAGFFALSAATADCEPHVMALVQDDAHEGALSEMASAADSFIELIREADMTPAALEVTVHERLLDGHRLFIHASHHDIARWLAPFASLADAGSIVAWLVSGEASDEMRTLSSSSLRAHGFTPYVLAEFNGEAQLFAAGTNAEECIALHDSVLGGVDVHADDPAVGAAGDVFGGQPSRAVDVRDAQTTAVAPLAASTAVTALHFIAPFCRTGYGIAGAYLLRALVERGSSVNFFPLGSLDSNLLPFKGLGDALSGQDSFDPSLPSVRLSQQFDLAMHVGHGPRIGFPIFELTRFTQRERHHLATQDRLLVCSEWARGVLLENGISRAPIRVVPLGVDRSVFHERLATGSTGDETVFLQVGKLESRKGQLELLRAFEAAFTPKDRVRLVLACHNPFVDAEAFYRATAPFRSSPLAARITLHTKPFATHREIATLMAAADCGVFLSRGEGWNLEALEMLSVGRSVIATNYSAHTEFLTEQNARLVHIDALEPVQGAAAGASWAAWGGAQHEQTVAALREVHAARQCDALARNDAGIETALRFSWENSAAQLMAALNA